MIVVDAHEDIAYIKALYDRDYRVSALTHRQNEQGMGRPAATFGLPDAILGRVALVFGTLYVSPARAKLSSTASEPSYSTPQEAYDAASWQLDYYRRITDEDERMRLVLTQSDLDEVLASWEEGKPMDQHLQGLVVLMEGADPVIEPEQFDEWYERGVRVLGTAWRQTRYSGGTGEPGGLSALGRDLLGQMSNYNALLDLSHMAEQAVYESFDMYEGQLFASHTNPRKFCNSDRHFSDDMIRRLAERDGVMGVVMFNRFLQTGWTPSEPRLPLSVVYDVIDYVCQLTGSARHIGIGSDFDGGFGSESIPQEMETVTDLWLLKDGLKERGYSEEDIENILGGNMVRMLRQTLPR
ncbi:membrane dipeptidase [Phototrophicus methaneseepsis]|uniref:Membrane dipeptidase n=1 Tax=Phototrophicus methaneseepsis TaxID=2710758 RepID=A0A7S8E946_9CHLR|nr:membrane dipeptidase [Phototrophicus methaneseepsis]QPC82553.1 membrane dipeptidase [Phototrophicus methaneseepsis]